MVINKSDPIIIVGAGAFGLSTAYHLSLAGYTDISVFDRHEQIPPRDSAANDINKIFRAEYEDPFYTNLTIDSFTVSQVKLLSELLRLFTDFKKPRRITHSWQNTWFQSMGYGAGPCSKWKGYLNRFDGYIHSGNALIALYNATRVHGVKFFLGQHGAVKDVVYQKSLKGREATGILTQAGQHVPAKLVIVAVGAAAARLIPECSKQVVAKSWSVAHVELTDDETSALRGIPVTYARDLGFYFEPDPKTNLLKLCPMGGGYVNTDPRTGVSLPPTYEDSQFMPLHDQKKVRQLLAETLPALKDRPLIKQTICWFADTSDSDFIIDYVPESNHSVVLMSGDSGHAAKLIPLVGDWVKNLLQAPDHKQPVQRWRWKDPGEKETGKWGDTVSWRLGNTVEFAEIRNARSSKL
ncbi:sarcosine oxidase [Colletotrichum tofieldiae]|nr:sarcosine oxidase [Colletotrichum tofieldiae]GKT76386.1 sarcosine oxidase [Colletotrichum tofieldiae]